MYPSISGSIIFHAFQISEIELKLDIVEGRRFYFKPQAKPTRLCSYKLHFSGNGGRKNGVIRRKCLNYLETCQNVNDSLRESFLSFKMLIKKLQLLAIFALAILRPSEMCQRYAPCSRECFRESLCECDIIYNDQ